MSGVAGFSLRFLLIMPFANLSLHSSLHPSLFRNETYRRCSRSSS
jgi:hypothetical protein